jgi:hypothetical protein
MKLVTDLPNVCFANPRLAALVARDFARSVMRVNQIWLRANPKCPRLYDLADNPRFRVKYAREPWAGTGVEDFAPIETCLKRGWGDCDDLAPWRAAEIREREKRPADILIYWRPGGAVWHLQTSHWPSVAALREDQALLAQGKKPKHRLVDDPSRLLGMSLDSE